MAVNNIRPIIFGEVLLDLFPNGNRVLGGAPFNVAWHLQGFGLLPLLITRIGNDEYGKEVIDVMKSWNMDLSGIQYDSIHPTGRVNVNFENNEPKYDIQENCAYDFIETNRINVLPKRYLLYHGTLALRDEENQQVLKYLYSQLLNNIDSTIFIDVNLRSPWYTLEHVLSILKNANYLKLNESELVELSSHLITNDIEIIAFSLKQQLKIDRMIVTQGAQGAFMIDDDEKLYETHTLITNNVVDTVGAGDAFSAILILGYLENWDVITTLKRAQEFASSIVSQQGATMRNSSLYSKFKESWSL